MKIRFKNLSDMSDGIYYIVYINGEWKVEAYRTDRYGDVDYKEVWEESLTPHLARNYDLNEGVTSSLKLACEGFPRGRIVKIGIKYVVYHGNDYKKLVSEDNILAPFGISEAEFKFDFHERVTKWDREVVRRLLGIRESWAAV